MSTKSKKASTGVRYTAEQKQNIVDFVVQHNASQGRGGQSAASKKFKVTPLTISAWLKAAGAAPKGSAKKVAKNVKAVKAVKVAKTVKAVKAVKAAKGAKAGKRGVRYSAEFKQEVVDFVSDFNASNGRGGQSRAAGKFGLSVLTVATWLKNSGAKKPANRKIGKAVVKAAATSVPAGLAAKVSNLITLSDEVRSAEVALEKLRGKLDAAKASVRSAI